jgi:hypothetical protein
MITDIPTPEDFNDAGLNQIYLAWQIAMQSVHDYEQAMEYNDDEDGEIATEYWKRSQPALANAYSLIQQGMELTLKGRIAAISPFLLIGHDPKDWPKGVDSKDVSFGEFRTLDAVDIVKVHNAFCSPRLGDEFKQFWEKIRKDRNKIMHSAKPKSFDPATVVKTILTAVKALFPRP